MVRAALAEQPVRERLVRCTLHKFLQDGLVVAALLLSDLLALGVEQHAVNERACRAAPREGDLVQGALLRFVSASRG